jgi:hypothetical protein
MSSANENAAELNGAVNIATPRPINISMCTEDVIADQRTSSKDALQRAIEK